MSLWTWLAARLRRPAPSGSVTPPEEHAEAQRRVDEINRETDRIQRLADDYRRMGRSLH